jgi:hypothetical protein
MEGVLHLSTITHQLRLTRKICGVRGLAPAFVARTCLQVLFPLHTFPRRGKPLHTESGGRAFALQKPPGCREDKPGVEG